VKLVNLVRGVLDEATECFTDLGKLKFADGGSILSSTQFLQLPQLTKKMKLALKMVKYDSKIIILLS
jgi:hypothetical protein